MKNSKSMIILIHTLVGTVSPHRNYFFRWILSFDAQTALYKRTQRKIIKLLHLSSYLIFKIPLPTLEIITVTFLIYQVIGYIWIWFYCYIEETKWISLCILFIQYYVAIGFQKLDVIELIQLIFKRFFLNF